ncbi:MAG: type II secretion system GspH family protein [Heliobacteriaceae bacterium]|jgi:prepilin-type N-terminal cleavage/methylation domain-containing protein|nr:type II secretion system GspH family protein [Heliobacteriaceae bacterium]
MRKSNLCRLDCFALRARNDVRGFTLAEVLITLGIIGVVAALTLPSLIQIYREKVIITKVKKYYSVLSQAHQRAVEEYGDPANWDLIANNSIPGAKNMAEKFIPYLQVTSSKPARAGYEVTLQNGDRILFEVRSADCTAVRGTEELRKGCGLLYLAPYKTVWAQKDGIDIFGFILTQNRIIPRGVPGDNMPFPSYCTKSGGLACTAWVLYNENMDYLRCSGLSWNGKTKCK